MLRVHVYDNVYVHREPDALRAAHECICYQCQTAAHMIRTSSDDDDAWFRLMSQLPSLTFQVKDCTVMWLLRMLSLLSLRVLAMLGVLAMLYAMEWNVRLSEYMCHFLLSVRIISLDLRSQLSNIGSFS